MPRPEFPVPPEALGVLRDVWGYPGFREGQADAVGAVLSGRDTLAVLPTGGGKSLVYQVPALVRPGVALVVSPLVALMRDQVEALAARGVRAAAVHAGLSPRRADDLWTSAEHGMYRVLYLTPERLETDLFRARAPRLPVSLLAVDEAHCISEWGHDFRPAYRRIADARALLSDAAGAPPPVVAVTATATPEVRRDVVQQLGLRDAVQIVQGFDRPGITWSVHHTTGKAEQVRRVFASTGGAGLVYAGTRRGCESWADRLRRAGLSAEAYHAGLDRDRRDAVQDRWLSDATRVVVATSAFGMGIDKPDVRAVVHVALPPTLEAYYQEAGRAGRDGATAFAALIVAPDDDRLPRRFATDGHPDADAVRAVYDAAASLSQIAVGDQPEAPQRLDTALVAEVAKVPRGTVRAATARLAADGVWAVSEPRAGTVSVRLADGAAPLKRFAESAAPRLAGFATSLLRALPPSAYDGWAPLRLESLAAGVGLPPERVLAGLEFLAARRLLELDAGDGLRVRWLAPRTRRVPLDAATLRQARTTALKRVDAVVDYANAPGCRRQFLLAYFGERAPSQCGRCDVCLGRRRPDLILPEDEAALADILRAVGAPADSVPTGRVAEPAAAPERRQALTDWLVHQGLLRLADPLAGRFELTPAGQRRLARLG